MDWKERYGKLLNKYSELMSVHRDEVIANKKREEREKRTRWELMVELQRMTELRDQLQEDFNALLDGKSNPQGSKK